MNVGEWLRSLGLEQYEAVFRENAIDADVLHDLTHDHLRELGLPLGARLRLLKAISALDPRAEAIGRSSVSVASTGPPVDTAERRQVTVMFSDLVGSTALSARMDLEDLREVISAYQKCVAETVRRFDGFVARYRQFFNKTPLGTATGFAWTIGDKYYLITNWHVVTCKEFPTGKYLNAHAGRPNMLRIMFNGADQIFWKQPFEITIRDSDDKPLWLVHPARKVDIAVVPLLLSDDQLEVLNLYPMNKLTSSDLAVYIGMEVFILGYPFGVEPPAYPIWKRGSIASEPDLAPFTHIYLRVDTASRPGMSGGPVILRSWTNHLMQDGTNRPLDATTRTRFIGVYSERFKAKDDLDTQIGMVWPATAIDEIIACNMRDTD